MVPESTKIRRAVALSHGLQTTNKHGLPKDAQTHRHIQTSNEPQTRRPPRIPIPMNPKARPPTSRLSPFLFVLQSVHRYSPSQRGPSANLLGITYTG